MSKPKFLLSSDTYKTELEIISISGTESISTLFSINVSFKIATAVANKLDHASLIQDDIKILIKGISNRSDYTIKGVFIQVEEEFKNPGSSTTSGHPKTYKYYSATLVPAFWRQRHNQSYDIFTYKTVPDILKDKLSHDLKLDHHICLSGDYPAKDFICQYSESNFQFISRLAEHWGVYYYIDHDQDGKLILADDIHYEHLPIASINLDQNNTPSKNYNSIRNLKRQFNTVPDSVVITEISPDQAREGFQGVAGKLTDGKASVNMANEGADNKKEAEDLAKIRLEELQSQTVVYSGTTGLACIAPGFILTVSTPTEEIDILIVSVSHNGNNLDDSARTQISASSPPYYECSFTGIPSTTQYRPKRNTKIPNIVSTTARVYSAASDQTLAQRNEAGRYQVSFDFMNAEAGKISSWIRHASHTARSNHLDMPLTPGTEVQIGFVGGNSNRPYILNALENSQSFTHPVTSENPHHAAVITDGMLYTAALKSRQTLHITSELNLADVKEHINNNALQQLDIDGGTTPGQAVDILKGDVHINRIYGDRYQWREGVDFNYGTNASFSFGSQYVENHASQISTDGEIFDIELNDDDLSAANTARGTQGKIGGVAAYERLAGLIQKDWGNTYTYHEGYAYNWSSGPKGSIHKTFNFGGCYVENNTKAGKPNDLLDTPFSGFKKTPTENDLITKTIGHTFDLHKGNKVDVHEGDVTSEMTGDIKSKMTGDTKEFTIGDLDSVTHGDTTEFTLGDIDSQITGNVTDTIIGDTDNFHTGDQKNVSVGNIVDCHIGQIKSQDQGSENVSMGASSDTFLGGKFDNFAGLLIESALQGQISNTRTMNLATGEICINGEEMSVRKTRKAKIAKSKVNIDSSSLSMFG